MGGHIDIHTQTQQVYGPQRHLRMIRNPKAGQNCISHVIDEQNRHSIPMIPACMLHGEIRKEESLRLSLKMNNRPISGGTKPKSIA